MLCVRSNFPFRLVVLGTALCFAASVFAIDSDESEKIGLIAMRRERPSITGAGIPVAQPEGQGYEASDAWQVPPFVNFSVFYTWTSDAGTTNSYPNSVGSFSSHAYNVGLNFYGDPNGVAPGVPRVDNYDAGYFIESIVIPLTPIPAQVVNQSFISPTVNYDTSYDAYATLYNVLFVSGMNNAPDTPPSPGSCYNGLGVGVFTTNTTSSIGPTSDGRAKPDLVAPNFCCTSFSTPLVSGAAALLLQAAATNDGGPNTASIATNSALVKALLINGAVKMTNWTNGFRRPLDARYGAGVLNTYNSDLQLRGGRRVAIATNNAAMDGSHPPTSDTGNIASLRGWDYSTIQSGTQDRVAHYYFNLPTNGGAFSATATLVWKKNGAAPLKNLDLFLYNTTNNVLVTCSTSSVDNVEHIFVPKLAAGRYDLQVLKHSGSPFDSENYALAFDFSPVTVSIGRNGTNVIVSWSASPAGFTLQAALSLTVPITWRDIATTSVLSNAMNTVTLPASNSMQFFRLFRP